MAFVFLLTAVSTCFSLEVELFSNDFDYQQQSSKDFSFFNVLLEDQDEDESDDYDDFKSHLTFIKNYFSAICPKDIQLTQLRYASENNLISKEEIFILFRKIVV
jgi:Na+-transporting NADH:ubiquinone oxidoreductase subunit NqrF